MLTPNQAVYFALSSLSHKTPPLTKIQLFTDKRGNKLSQGVISRVILTSRIIRIG